jgi:sigma-B regulation protein RsbU (phosphoserine phosphatase)
MDNKLSMSYMSFDGLSKSSEFLTLVLNNIGTCVLMLDKDMMLVALNDVSKTIFSNYANEHNEYRHCGNVLGCSWTVETQQQCGTTEACKICSLREAGLITILTKKPIYKSRLDREFYTIDGEKAIKHLQFSTRVFEYLDENYVIVFVEDITHLIEQHELIHDLKERLQQLGDS